MKTKNKLEMQTMFTGRIKVRSGALYIHKCLTQGEQDEVIEIAKQVIISVKKTIERSTWMDSSNSFIDKANDSYSTHLQYLE